MYTFLECQLMVHNKYITIKHNHKNYESLLRTGKQKLYKMQHYNSYTPRQTKLALIVGSLHRLNNNSMNESSLCQSIFILWYELQSLHYSKQFFKHALVRMYTKTKQYKWKHYLHLFTHYYNKYNIHKQCIIN